MEIAVNNVGRLPQSRHLTPIGRPERFRSLTLFHDNGLLNKIMLACLALDTSGRHSCNHPGISNSTETEDSVQQKEHTALVNKTCR